MWKYIHYFAFSLEILLRTTERKITHTRSIVMMRLKHRTLSFLEGKKSLNLYGQNDEVSFEESNVKLELSQLN